MNALKDFIFKMDPLYLFTKFLTTRRVFRGQTPKGFILLRIADVSLFLVLSAKPQEFKARVENRHKAKKDVLGHSKQAEFVRLMEQEVQYELCTEHRTL